MTVGYVKNIVTVAIALTLLVADWITIIGAVIILLLLVRDLEMDARLRKEYIIDFALVGVALYLQYADWITFLGTGIILVLLVDSIIGKYLEARKSDEDR